MSSTRRRICIVIHGHVSTCPRMLKAADALCEAGHDVRVVSPRHLGWATEADREVWRSRRWRHTEVGFEDGSPRRARSALRWRLARQAARLLPRAALPTSVAARAIGRFQPELLAAACAEPADLFYGGTGATQWVVAEAARRQASRYALDAEDFHPGEHDTSPAGRRMRSLVMGIERAFLPGACFITAGSSAIADAYRALYGIVPIAVHNTFPLPAVEPSFERASGAALRLYWFSQTIGPTRGLEELVQAIARARISAELHLRGVEVPGYVAELQRSCRMLRIEVLPPVPPDELVNSCRGFDAGLSLEQPAREHRAVCLTNKALTYILAGVSVVLTDTPGQRPFAADLGEGALLYPPGDVSALAVGLSRWATDPAALAAARRAAWDAARTRWHWEHALERGALLDAVERALA
jgi:glycosyltransferase involved in cell wall biosynthesis